MQNLIFDLNVLTVNYEATRCHMIKKYLSEFVSLPPPPPISPSLTNPWKIKDTLDLRRKTKCFWSATNVSNFVANAFPCNCADLQFSRVHFKMCEKFDIRNCNSKPVINSSTTEKSGEKQIGADLWTLCYCSFHSFCRYSWWWELHYASTHSNLLWIYSRLSCINLWDGYVW